MNFHAAVQREAGQPLQIEALRLGELTAADVVVRIGATSLCHTDLEAVEGQLGTPLPFVPGHEAAGVVEWVGASVRKVRPGDPVILSWNPSCGSCYFCAQEQPIVCSQYRAHAARSVHFDGQPRIFSGTEPVHQLMYAGSFAELAVVTEDCAIPIPSELPLEVACLIGCGVMTGVGAVRNIAQLRAGQTVAVIGCGAVGLSAIQGARMAQAGLILAIDRDPARLATAAGFGATHRVEPGPDGVAAAWELTRGIGLDCVIECAGNEAAFRLSMELVRPGGQTVWLGKVPVHQEVSFRWGSLMGEKVIRRSSYGGARPAVDFPWLAQAYLSGELRLDEYITSRINLWEINDGLARLKAGRELRSVACFV